MRKLPGRQSPTVNTCTRRSAKYRLFRAAPVVSGIALALIGLVRAEAGKPKVRAGDAGSGMIAKGEWSDCNTISESRQDGENQLITVAIAEKFTGTLNGSYEGTERNIVHKDGSGSFNGSGTFSGEVNGRSGTAVMTYAGTVDAKGDATAHWVLDQGTDGLARVDGHGTFEGKQVKPAPPGCSDRQSQSAFSGTYAGTVQLPL